MRYYEETEHWAVCKLQIMLRTIFRVLNRAAQCVLEAFCDQFLLVLQPNQLALGMPPSKLPQLYYNHDGGIQSYEQIGPVVLFIYF